MNNTRFLKIVIFVLIVINLGTLAFMWFNRPGNGISARRPVAAGFLVKELELSGSQRKEYFRLRSDHRIMLKELQEHDKALHNLFFEQLFSEVPDPKSVHDLADSIAENRRKMEMLTYDHFNHVKQILTPAQQKKFGEIFDEVLRMVLPPPPSPPLPPSPETPPPPTPLPSAEK